MEPVPIFWDPQGIAMNTLGNRSTISQVGDPHDGDTPYVKVPIRMLGIDTPETSYPGVGSSSNSDDTLLELAEWLSSGRYNVSKALIEYLLPKLLSGRAGTLQRTQGLAAKAFLTTRMVERLRKPNGRKRSLFLRTSRERFDQYGRILAYTAPKFSKEELNELPFEERVTFNYELVKAGWASTLLIYPNLPKNRDLNLIRTVAQEAFEQKRGIWQDDLTLNAYEWRMCIKLHQAIKALGRNQTYIREENWIQRFCIDMTDLTIYYPQDYHKVAPYDRIFVWSQDVNDAVSQLNLRAGIK